MTHAVNTTNRLIHEKSPYLLQHAHNPVDWYPWGKEAFDAARAQDKPIFLSIGYSTCHWCHVMERESFEDEEVAQLLNKGFICIKVDREERTDIDAVYMQVCQAMTGQGGWPLTILMTPEQKPFFAATYLPKHNRYGTAGLMELLPEVIRLWEQDKQSLLHAGEEISRAVSGNQAIQSKPPEKALIKRAVRLFKENFDNRNGGFGSAPKFPSPHNLVFLLRYAYLEQDEIASDMVETTLMQMYRGGIFDHIGGGFSRYSTDNRWLVPHFEKMLYDNALLIETYTEAYQLTGKELYRDIAGKTAMYVLHELTDKTGGFYCGQDADSEGVEGKYYVFTPEEIQQVLGKEQGDAFCNAYDITETGNFEGKSIPNLLSNGQLITADKDTLDTLYDYRTKRTSLHKDDKILTSWNSLMIAALAKAGYLEAAQNAQAFIEEHLTDGDRLLVRWRDGDAAGDGKLEDYAFYSRALLELYDATYEVKYLQWAIHIAEKMLEQFSDAEQGGLYLYSADGEQLISRPKESFDGAVPSGNSVAAEVFLRLFALTGELEWRDIADKQLAYLAGEAEEYPAGYSFAMTTMLRELYGTKQLVCATRETNFSLDGYYPQLTILVKTKENSRELEQVAPFTKDYPLPETGTLYYLCENGVCRQPVTDLHTIL